MFCFIYAGFGWHGQTLFVRACLVTHYGMKVTEDVAGHCPPLAGDQGGGKAQVKIPAGL